jgi:hypothetical protein
MTVSINDHLHTELCLDAIVAGDGTLPGGVVFHTDHSTQAVHRRRLHEGLSAYNEGILTNRRVHLVPVAKGRSHVMSCSQET